MDVSTLALLLAQIATVLLVSRGLGLLTKRVGQPLVIAEMVAGIVLGPSVLGALFPRAFDGLFPSSSLGVLKIVSQVGLVLFMFLVGLELDPGLLRGRRRASLLISHSSIALPFALGVGGAYWLHHGYAPGGVPFLPFALFLGTAMSVTAFPVLARILAERGLMHTHVGAIAIACAAIDDVTAWCLLAVVVAIARSGGVGGALGTIGLAVVFSAFMLLLARPLLGKLGAHVAARGLGRTAFAGVLACLLLAAGVTEAIGIHALFGAFLFGVVLPREGRLPQLLAEKLESLAVVLLMPLFFAYSGLRTRLGLVSGVEHWLVVALVIGLATLGKFGGSACAARWSGMPWREASALGVLMNTRGLMELIVLNVGMDLGVITPTLFTILVLMALITTFATSPMLRWVYPEPSAAAPDPLLIPSK